jgi:undecaprenyl-diphosphatase
MTSGLSSMSARHCATRRRWSLAGSIGRGVGVGLLLCLAVDLINMFPGTNLHVVVPGMIYRSAQISDRSLDRFVRRLGIRTIINLRGTCCDEAWYLEECRACSRLGISQQDLPFSANHLPSLLAIRQLIEVLDRSEYPILFHCFRGVDRTGLATVIALLLKTDTPLQEARRSLSGRYLHLSFGRTGNLDRFLDYYETWLREHDWKHSSDRFRRWATCEYRGGNCNGRIELLGLVLPGREQLEPVVPNVLTNEGPNACLRVRVPRDTSFAMRIRCHNTSDETWRFHPFHNTGIHVFRSTILPQGWSIDFRRAGCLPAEVPPGSSLDVTVPFPPLRIPDKIHIQLGLLDERNCFFHEVALDLLDLQLEEP